MTATLQIADYEQRVRDILATYPGIGTDVSEGDDIRVLPAYEATCTTGRASRIRSGRRFIVTRTVSVWVYVCELRDSANEQFIRQDLTAAKALIDPVADFLGDHPLLGLSIAVIQRAALVSAITSPSDNGAGLLSYNKKAYAGFGLTFDITYGR